MSTVGDHLVGSADRSVDHQTLSRGSDDDRLRRASRAGVRRLRPSPSVRRARQRAVTTVVQALPIFGRSWLPAASQSSAIRSPRAKGQ